VKKPIKIIVIIVVIILVVGGLGSVAWLRYDQKLSLASVGGPGENGSDMDSAVPVAVYRARTERISDSLRLNAEVLPRASVSIYSTVPGKVENIQVEEGDRVRNDQVLGYIDRSEAGLSFAPTPVESTISGVVGDVFVETGAYITPQIPLFQIVDMDQVEVVTNVPEKELNRIETGLPAEVSVIPYPDRVFRGRVSRMSPVVDPASRTQKVRILIDNPEHVLKPGMFGEVRIILDTSSGHPVVPLQAVLEREGTRYLFVVQEGTARKLEPEFGIREGERIAVVSGVEQGERVIVVGQQNVDHGDMVRVTEEVDQ
jgi:multidrug efflux pump subunit AcrA (membrane-fusion protein)